MNWEGVELLECKQNYGKRRILETIWIRKTKRNSNLDCDMMPNPIWLAYITLVTWACMFDLVSLTALSAEVPRTEMPCPYIYLLLC